MRNEPVISFEEICAELTSIFNFPIPPCTNEQFLNFVHQLKHTKYHVESMEASGLLKLIRAVFELVEHKENRPADLASVYAFLMYPSEGIKALSLYLPVAPLIAYINFKVVNQIRLGVIGKADLVGSVEWDFMQAAHAVLKVDQMLEEKGRQLTKKAIDQYQLQKQTEVLRLDLKRIVKRRNFLMRPE